MAELGLAGQAKGQKGNAQVGEGGTNILERVKECCSVV